MPSLAHIHSGGLTDPLANAGSFVNVPAEEILRLLRQQEIADGGRAGVQPVTHAIERSAVWRRMTDQHQRLQPGERGQPLAQFRFTVLTGGVEGRGTRVTQTGDVVVSKPELLPVKV